MFGTLFTDKPIVTRKKHPCIWCGEIIKKGERCQYKKYTFDGDIHGDWLHFECEKAQGDFASNASYDTDLEGFEPYSFKRGKTEEK